MNLNVLVISHMYPRNTNPVKGIFVHEQVKELVKLGCIVKVISAVPWSPFPLNRLSSRWRNYARIPAKAEWEGLEVFYPRYLCFPGAAFFEYSGFFLYWAIRKLVADIRFQFNFDLVHAHVAIPDGFTGVLLKEKYCKPLVVTIHGKDIYLSVHKKRKTKVALKRVFDRADRIVMVSNPLKKLAVDILGFNDKIVTIGNGVPLKKIIPPKEICADKNHKIILSASNLILSKGLEYNLKAVARLVHKHPGLKYYVVGDGAEVGRLQTLTTALDLGGHVYFWGRVSHQDTLKLMSEADLFSMPSWVEAFGVAYIEAMAHGKPVIGCRGTGIEDFVEDKITGLLVNPRDVDSLAEAMDYLLSNPVEARAMGERARKVVLNEYTWEKNAQRNLVLYEELTADNNKYPR